MRTKWFITDCIFWIFRYSVREEEHRATRTTIKTSQSHQPRSPAINTSQSHQPRSPAINTSQSHQPRSPAINTSQSHQPRYSVRDTRDNTTGATTNTTSIPCTRTINTSPQILALMVGVECTHQCTTAPPRCKLLLDKTSKASQWFSTTCSLWTRYQIILHYFNSGGHKVVPHNAVPQGTAWFMPNQETHKVGILPGIPIYTPGLRAEMWIPCLAEGQKYRPLVGFEPWPSWTWWESNVHTNIPRHLHGANCFLTKCPRHLLWWSGFLIRSMVENVDININL